MVLVYLTTDECIEIPEAHECRREDARLVCYDANGSIVRSFLLEDVSVFTNDPEAAQLVKQEVCEEEEEQRQQPSPAL